DLATKLAGPQHAVGRRGQRDEDCIVRTGQSALSIDLRLENAEQVLVEAQPAAPEVGFAFVKPSRFRHHQDGRRLVVDVSAILRYCGYVSQVEGVDPYAGSNSECAPDP